MTPLQNKLEKALAELHKEEKDFSQLHKKAEEKRKNVIVPLQLEVKSLLIQVHGERQTNYKIESK